MAKKITEEEVKKAKNDLLETEVLYLKDQKEELEKKLSRNSTLSGQLSVLSVRDEQLAPSIERLLIGCEMVEFSMQKKLDQINKKIEAVNLLNRLSRLKDKELLKEKEDEVVYSYLEDVKEIAKDTGKNFVGFPKRDEQKVKISNYMNAEHNLVNAFLDTFHRYQTNKYPGHVAYAEQAINELIESQKLIDEKLKENKRTVIETAPKRF